LPERPLLQAASVIYHEGMPGHHLQMGLLVEDTALHPIRRVPTELRTFALNGYLRKLRGSRDAREFHKAVLAQGPLPLAILGQYA
jgi:uncharacterized protein (DUF885 family)